jgi:uncharacterized protein (TIGR03437 family)
MARLLYSCALAVLPVSWIFAQSYTTKTYAGSDRLLDGHAANTVPLRYPWGTAQDAAGNIYISDNDDNRIRKVDLNGNISTVAGNGVSGYSGDGSQAIDAMLSGPQGIRLDGQGNLFIADYNNNVIRKVVLSTGIITTVAGNGNFVYSGEGGPALSAGLDPYDLAVDGAGNIYIADYYNNRIRKVSAANQTISTIAGIGIPGDGENGPANQAAVNGPIGISVGSTGFVYFVDSGNNLVKKIDQSANKISVAAGNGNFGFGEPSFDGDGGPATQASLAIPFSTAIDSNGNLLIDCIVELWRVNISDGTIHFLAGSDTIGFAGDGGLAIDAKFAGMLYASAAPNGDILIADVGNFRVRRIHNSVVNTVAGTTILDNIPATTAFLNAPDGIVPDGKGGLLIADTGDSRVRDVSQAGVITNYTGTGIRGTATGELFFPSGITMDGQGAVFIADTNNNRVMKITPGGSLTVIAGGGGAGYNGDGSFAVRALLNAPTGVAVDPTGNVYIADEGNSVVRMIDTNQVITTIAGTGVPGFSNDNGPAKLAKVATHDLTVFAGSLYLAEALTNRIRKIDLSTKVISTVVGIGTPGPTGDGGPAFSAQLDSPLSVAFDATGNMYIADEGNFAVRRVSGSTITTIAGNRQPESNTDFGTALGVSIDPTRIAVDTSGTIYITDAFNDRVRVLQPQTPAKLAIHTGNNASGPPGAVDQIVVSVADGSGNPVGGALVNFTVTSGSATLSASSATTLGDGTAGVQVTFGANQGAVAISAASAGLNTVMFALTVTAPPVVTPVPQIAANGITGAGFSVPAIQALSTGGIGTVKGGNFGVGSTFLLVGASDLVNGQVPVNFHGVCLTIGGVRAFIFGASDTQINFQTPALSAGTTAGVQVISGCDTSSPITSATVNIPIQSATPEFFYFANNANGHNPVAATDSVTGAYLVASSQFPGAGFSAAQQNEYVTAYATGFGATSPSFAPGVFPSAGGNVTANVTVALGGNPLPAANVLYVGVTPGDPGLYQLNIQIPPDAPDGDLSLVITVGGVSSPPGAFLTVQSATSAARRPH